jgi:hypothetical protein
MNYKAQLDSSILEHINTVHKELSNLVLDCYKEYGVNIEPYLLMHEGWVIPRIPKHYVILRDYHDSLTNTYYYIAI